MLLRTCLAFLSLGLVLASASCTPGQNHRPSGSGSSPDRDGTTEKPAEIKTKINPADEAEMVYVPPGQFHMGSSKRELNALWKKFDWDRKSLPFAQQEIPLHEVTLTQGYWIYRTEVTNEMYQRFVDGTDHRPPRCRLPVRKDGEIALEDMAVWDHREFNRPNQPVVGVNWEDAKAYCEWAGARLPTEAEWEYAARGTDGRNWPWGNDVPDNTRAVFRSASRETNYAQECGGRLAGASPFGALDMAGNVMEWCADWYGPYRSEPQTDPQGPETGKSPVVRGGSVGDPASWIRAAIRIHIGATWRSPITGFRPVVTADGPEG